MAGDWMQIDCDLPEKREVVNIVCETGCELDTTLGRLVRFWRWVERHFDGPTMASANVRTVSALCGGDEKFWRAVEKEEWVSFEDNGVSIPGYKKRFSKSAKRRALDAKRKSAKRPQRADKKRTHTGPKEDLEEMRGDEKKEHPNGCSIPPLPPILEDERFKEVLTQWLDYKQEKRQPYKPTGLKNMITMAAQRAHEHTLPAVIRAFEKAMGNGWQGWDQENSFTVKSNGKSNSRPNSGSEPGNPGRGNL